MDPGGWCQFLENVIRPRERQYAIDEVGITLKITVRLPFIKKLLFTTDKQW